MKCKPITNLLNKIDGPVTWCEKCEQALINIVDCIIAGGLKLARFDLPFIIYTDFSFEGIGAVLTQEVEGKEFPIMFASRTLI